MITIIETPFGYVTYNIDALWDGQISGIFYLQ